MTGHAHEADARRALHEHCAQKASEARLKNGLLIDDATILRMLDDRSIVRYPTGLRFDAEPLREGEFACLVPLGEHPSEGYCLFVHPAFEAERELLPLIVAYYIPSVNYGDVAGHVEAEIFGSTLVGMEREAYYRTLCDAADSLDA